MYGTSPGQQGQFPIQPNFGGSKCVKVMPLIVVFPALDIGYAQPGQSPYPNQNMQHGVQSGVQTGMRQPYPEGSSGAGPVQGGATRKIHRYPEPGPHAPVLRQSDPMVTFQPGLSAPFVPPEKYVKRERKPLVFIDPTTAAPVVIKLVEQERRSSVDSAPKRSTVILAALVKGEFSPPDTGIHFVTFIKC